MRDVFILVTELLGWGLMLGALAVWHPLAGVFGLGAVFVLFSTLAARRGGDG